jgi:hypothetical protein
MPDTKTGVVEHAVPPHVPTALVVPSWPEELSPQHSILPLESSAQDEVWPAATDVAVVMLETVVLGAWFQFVVPSPSSPSGLSPQQVTVPPVSSAQANIVPFDSSPPAETIEAPLSPAASSLVGRMTPVPREALPGKRPQHAAVPSEMSAQVCEPTPLIDFAVVQLLVEQVIAQCVPHPPQLF